MTDEGELKKRSLKKGFVTDDYGSAIELTKLWKLFDEAKHDLFKDWSPEGDCNLCYFANEGRCVKDSQPEDCFRLKLIKWLGCPESHEESTGG